MELFRFTIAQTEIDYRAEKAERALLRSQGRGSSGPGRPVRRRRRRPVLGHEG